jgi:leucyl-tRNA---protein transferase
MNARTIPLFNNISFNPNPIEEYLNMQPLHPMVFDQFCEDGWCYWSDLIFRRNYWEWRNKPCRVIMIRIRLDGFEFTKSQRKCLRRNSDLIITRQPINITPMHEVLFSRHAQRFSHNQPMSIYGFFSHFSNIMPSYGVMFDVFKRGKLLASSFVHVGIRSVAANYCIHEPEEASRSLGTFTMLKEIEATILAGREYYYPGFVYDVPSEFDYKLSFHNLEYYDWWGNWYPLERLPLRDWRSLYEVAPPLTDAEMLEYGRGFER